MNLKRKEYETKAEKQLDFIIGVAVWILVNALFAGGFVLFATMSASTSWMEDPTASTLINIGIFLCSIGPFVANIGGIIFLAIYRRWIAFGMLATIGAAMVVVICLGVVLIGVCGAALSGNSF